MGRQKEATTDAERRREDALAIFRAGLQGVEPIEAVKRYVRREGDLIVVDGERYSLADYRRIVLIGGGKAAAPMARAIEECLDDVALEGLISVKYGHLDSLQAVAIRQAGHPVPDEQGFLAAREMFSLAESADERTLVFCLLSGGGSALLPFPVAGVSLADKQETTRSLLACGATIHEINAIRKHLSVIKGGGLARAVYPGRLITLILSDVVGDDLDSIASGPCVADNSTFADCLEIIQRYSLEADIPSSVLDYLRMGARGKRPETPKEGDPFFAMVKNVIVGNNYNALLFAKTKAEELGYATLILSSMMEGDTRVVSGNHVAIGREILLHGHPVPGPACILTGGETTVRLTGAGKGGRNQEFALAALCRLREKETITIVSAGTDGSDGPTDAAGAIADSIALSRCMEKGLNASSYLAENDSYTFFDAVDSLIRTGPTNTNVMDIRIILVR